ncbi:hypothetical protein Q9966_013296 [Columba livia]|nr:hypothetical protein Q9966_013296 [Columba livia]
MAAHLFRTDSQTCSQKIPSQEMCPWLLGTTADAESCVHSNDNRSALENPKEYCVSEVGIQMPRFRLICIGVQAHGGKETPTAESMSRMPPHLADVQGRPRECKQLRSALSKDQTRASSYLCFILKHIIPRFSCHYAKLSMENWKSENGKTNETSVYRLIAGIQIPISLTFQDFKIGYPKHHRRSLLVPLGFLMRLSLEAGNALNNFGCSDMAMPLAWFRLEDITWSCRREGERFFAASTNAVMLGADGPLLERVPNDGLRV